MSLRILVFIHSFEPGGVEKTALRLVSAWLAKGVDVHLVVGRAEGAMRTTAPPLAYEFLQSGRLSTRRFETLWMIARLPAVIRRQQPDVIFCAGNAYAIVAVALKLLLGRRCPAIVIKISNDLLRRDMPFPIRWAYRIWLRVQGRCIDRFVGLAEPQRAEIAKALRVPAARIDIVEDPALASCDIEWLTALRAQWNRPRSGRRYIAAGRLVEQKNFRLLIEAFAGMALLRDRLVILGEGPERATLEELARALGVAERVEMPGYVDPGDNWLAKSDVFVLSSNYEGVPAVIIEALATGLPIIATDCSISIATLLAHGRLGRLVPIGDRTGLAAAMATIPSTCPACASIIAARFTVERAAPSYLRILSEAAGRPGDTWRQNLSASNDRCADCQGPRRHSFEPKLVMDA